MSGKLKITYREYFAPIYQYIFLTGGKESLKNTNTRLFKYIRPFHSRIAVDIPANIMPAYQYQFNTDHYKHVIWFIVLFYRVLMVSKKPILFSVLNFVRSDS
jgi:hypothetical protein